MHSEIKTQSRNIWNPDHLDQVQETYWQHAKFAIWAGLILVSLGVLSIIHAIFPFLFSRYPDAIYRYFVDHSRDRMLRVNHILKTKKLE